MAMISRAREQSSHLGGAESPSDAVELRDYLAQGKGVRELGGELQVVGRREQGAIEIRDERARLLDLRVLTKESASRVRIVPEGRKGDFVG
jgi:hypothetical protein